MKLKEGMRPKIRPFLSSVWGHGLEHFKCPGPPCSGPSQPPSPPLTGTGASCYRKAELPFLTPSSEERNPPQTALFIQQPRLTLLILRAPLYLRLTHLKKPAVDSKGTMCFVSWKDLYETLFIELSLECFPCLWRRSTGQEETLFWDKGCIIYV